MTNKEKFNEVFGHTLKNCDSDLFLCYNDNIEMYGKTKDWWNKEFKPNTDEDSKETIIKAINTAVDTEIMEIKNMKPDAGENEFDLQIKKQHWLAECNALKIRIYNAIK